MKYEIFRTDDGSDTVKFAETEISFHSKNGALQESREVFIKNGFDFYLSRNSKQPIKIFEVGFGTGLNALLTAVEAAKNRRNVVYYAIDLRPLPMEIFAKLNYPSLLTEPELYKIIMQTSWDQLLYASPFLKLKKIKSDFSTYIFNENFDVIYFDAFAPEDQNEMWTPHLYKKMYETLSNSGVLVTYCSKSVVRKGLTDAGFYVEKLSGPPGKREIIRAIKI